MIRDRMIGGALVEAMLTLWASSSRDAKQRVAVYTRAGRSSARQFLDALFGNEPRKTPSRAISQANDCNQQESRSLIAPATF
jgi:hypothetical protein